MMPFSDIVDAFVSSGIYDGVLQILVTLSPVILAYVLFMIFWPLWTNYVRSDFVSSLKYTLLEVKLPKDMMKSPLAMEVFLTAIHNTSDGSNFAKYWKGERRPSYSLELISLEGIVKFMIWTEDRRKQGVMSALYSQFPGIEVHEVQDYTYGVQFDPAESKMWGGEFKFTKPDPYPIKTYVDYGLNKDPDEELKVDPLSPTIEFLGNLGMNQQIWIQYVVRAHIKDQKKSGHWLKKTDSWQDQAQDEINKIMQRDAKTKVAGKKDKETGRVTPPTLSEGEKVQVEALGRSVTKQAFDVGIRVVYLAKKEVFDKPNGIGGIVSSFKQFSSEHLNGLKPNGDLWSPRFNGSPWEDYKNMRQNKACRLALEAFKRRCFFDAPFNDGQVLVLNTEELATLYHFPGQVVQTPNLNRISSRKSEAPANLPV